MNDDIKRLAAVQRAELYFQAHPGSPAAVRRPSLFQRGGMWVALLGTSIQNGFVGLGPTVETALRAFDARYLATLRPPPPVRVRKARAVKFSTNGARS